MYSKQAQLDEFQILRFLNQQQIIDEAGNELDYPKDKCRFIMEAMKEFKLCYPLPGDRKTLIIPELLPTDQPDSIPFEKTGALAFEFVFRGFLPRHVMPELIVNRHEEIVNSIVWQRGVLLEHKLYYARALLQVDYHERVLSIWVNGRDAKEYLGLLNDEVLKILGRLDLDYEERVELPLSACMNLQIGLDTLEKVDYRQLLNSVRSGIYNFPTKSNTYDLRKVLGIIMPETELSKAGIYINQLINGDNTGSKTVTTINQNVNNSIINGSVVAAEKIENSFNSLQESKAGNEVKILLEQLLAEIKALNDKVPATQAHQLDDLAEGAETLISETVRELPRKKWYEASLDGIKEAALVVGEIAKPVLDIAEKLALLLN